MRFMPRPRALRDAQQPRWRRCRRSKDTQSDVASAPCLRGARRRSLARCRGL